MAPRSSDCDACHVTPETLLVAGNEILSPVLGEAGFSIDSQTFSTGSGGPFGVSRWVRGTQWIELHVRWALGIVCYGWGDESFDHAHMVGALGVTASYPGFSQDPIDGFRHLTQDLEGPLAPILSKNNEPVQKAARRWTPPKRQLP